MGIKIELIYQFQGKFCGEKTIHRVISTIF